MKSSKRCIFFNPPYEPIIERAVCSVERTDVLKFTSKFNHSDTSQYNYPYSAVKFLASEISLWENFKTNSCEVSSKHLQEGKWRWIFYLFRKRIETTQTLWGTNFHKFSDRTHFPPNIFLKFKHFYKIIKPILCQSIMNCFYFLLWVGSMHLDLKTFFFFFFLSPSWHQPTLYSSTVQ